MAPLATQRIRPGYRGMNTTASPEYLEDGEAVYLENLLPGREGKLVVRGSFMTRSSQQPSSNQALSGIWTHNGTGRILYSYLASGTPTNRHLAADSTGLGTTNAENYAMTGYNLAPSFQYAQIGDYVYGRNDGSGLAADSRIVRWDGNTGSSAYLTLTNSPAYAVDVVDHLERLFVLGGTEPGTSTPTYKDRVWWTDRGGPTADTLAMWQDDASGLTNQIALRGDGDPGVGLVKAGRNLAILRTSSIYLLTGQTPASFALQRVAERGCLNAESVVEYKDGFFFMSHDGFYYFDGVNTTEVSAPIRNDLAQFLRGTSGVYKTYATKLAHDFIHVSITPGGILVGPKFSGIYHAPSGAWTYLTAHTDVMPVGQPVQGVSMIAYQNIGSLSTAVPKIHTPLLWDGVRLWRAENITFPEQGTAPGQDFATINRHIPVVYRSRITRLASPTQRAQLHRVMMDYRYTESSGSNAGFGISVVNGDGTVLLPETTFKGTTATIPLRQRAQAECFAECTEAQVIIRRTQDAPLPLNTGTFKGEIFDIWLEFQPTRQ